MLPRTALVLALLVIGTASGTPQQPLRVKGIPGVVADGAVLEFVKGGFTFPEGLVATADGSIYFCERGTRGEDAKTIPTHIYHLDPKGQLKVVREDAAANGLAIDRSGNLLATDLRNRRVTRMDKSGTVTVVTERSTAGPFVAPNDMAVDRGGGIYFTDPSTRPVVPGRKVYVYYLPPGAKEAIVVDDNGVRPNGLVLSNDEKTLILGDTYREVLFAFDVQPDGMLRNRRPFGVLHNIGPERLLGQGTGAGGMAIDRDDRVYIVTIAGLQIYDRTGRHLGIIDLPAQGESLTFSGPDSRTLYIAVRGAIYRLPTLTRGPDRPGGK